MRIFLMTESLKIPLSFSSRSLDPFFGIVVILAMFINCGITFSSFILLNIFKRDSFKFVPIVSFLNISLIRPSLSLVLLFLRSFRAVSSFVIFQILVLFNSASLIFRSKMLIFLSSMDFKSGLIGLVLNLSLYSFDNKAFSSVGSETILPTWFIFAVGNNDPHFGHSFSIVFQTSFKSIFSGSSLYFSKFSFIFL